MFNQYYLQHDALYFFNYQQYQHKFHQLWMQYSFLIRGYQPLFAVYSFNIFIVYGIVFATHDADREANPPFPCLWCGIVWAIHLRGSKPHVSGIDALFILFVSTHFRVWNFHGDFPVRDKHNSSTFYFIEVPIFQAVS